MSRTVRSMRWSLCAAVFAAGVATLAPGVAAGGGHALRLAAAAVVLAVIGCGWHSRGPSMPTRLVALFMFGLSAGTFGGLISGLS
jgi:threonine/homoserine efflux transporter RhtA